MIFKELLKFKFHIFYRRLFTHLIFWCISLLLFVFLTEYNELFINYFNLLKIDYIYTNILFLAVVISFLFTFLDILLSDKLLRRSPIRALIFLRSILYFSISLCIIIIATNPPQQVLAVRSIKEVMTLIPEMKYEFIKFMVYFYIACIINNIYKETHRKVGVSNFFDWLSGTLNKPREENRIFMMIDMKASTTHAEKLGHKKFSHLVQDVFNDMALIDNFYGEIYQYVGDGAIISWNVNKGLKNNNYLRAFFAFSRAINRKRRYYERKYGIVPEFKAGAHIGRIMVLQVGNIRRDISYNGDTLNTTARIESMCGTYKQDLLISGLLFESTEDKNQFNFKEVGNIKLKGKQRTTLLYQVKLKVQKK